MDTVIGKTRALPAVPLEETTAYKNHREEIVREVDETLGNDPSINELIGNNPLRVMYDNHKNHAAFMATVFSIANYELMVRVVVWVYRAYHAHGFSFDYFPRALESWEKAVQKHVPDNPMKTVLSIYRWLRTHHDLWIALSKEIGEIEVPESADWMDARESFHAALLEGNHGKCLKLAEEIVTGPEDVVRFYLEIVQPAMYEIGREWERGEISVAQEHLASAIVCRVIPAIHASKVQPSSTAGRVVVTTASNEFHEIGGWMIADSLEIDGFEVRYLGANTPKEDLLDLLRSFRPDILAVSVTMPFNIEHAAEVIKEVKQDEVLATIHVMIGGLVFNGVPDLWRKTGADAYAANLEDARRLAKQWMNGGGE
jgi:methanogenic corrinoid protein MtbC1